MSIKGKLVYKGGPGSGHHGHGGRPGKRGGSLPGGGSKGSGGSVDVKSVMRSLPTDPGFRKKMHHDEKYPGVEYKPKNMRADWPDKNYSEMVSAITNSLKDSGWDVTESTKKGSKLSKGSYKASVRHTYDTIYVDFSGVD